LSIRFFIVIITFILSAGAVKNSYADDTIPQSSNNNTDTTVYIRAIEIHGNVTTRSEVLNQFITFKVGDELDLTALTAARINLVKTHLYDKVDIFPNMREDGAYVFIILKEAVRQSISYGGEYGTHKYGERNLWWSVHLDAGLSNFRGRLEDISGGVSFWEHRGVRASWHKPLLSTPYFIGAAAAVAVYPDEWLTIDYRDISARVTAGRYIGKYSHISISAIPIQRCRSWTNDLARIAPLPDIYEAFGVAGFVNDLRSSRFDPRSGWFLRNEIRTNRLYYDLTEPFVQYRNDFRFYQPMLFDDVAALRLSMTLRDRDAGHYHRLLYGDAGHIRGYSQKELGWDFVTNSSILMSVKYHKPIWKSHPVKVPLINAVYTGVQKISYRIDAALIADYARLYGDPHGALIFKGPMQDAAGLGGGMRVVFPEIRQSGCIDLVYGRHDKISENGDRKGYTWKPVLHVYFDIFY